MKTLRQFMQESLLVEFFSKFGKESTNLRARGWRQVDHDYNSIGGVTSAKFKRKEGNGSIHLFHDEGAKKSEWVHATDDYEGTIARGHGHDTLKAHLRRFHG